MPSITLGTVGELEMRGLAFPGMESARNPVSVVCLPADRALRLLLPILDKLWKLDRKAQAELLEVSPSTLGRYRRGAVPRGREQLGRTGSLLRIYAALRVLLPQAEAADAWPTRSNTRFRPNPVAYMTRRGTKDVERYLQAALVE